MVEQNNADNKRNLPPRNKQLTIEEYRALQEKEAKKAKGVKIPLIVKILLVSPLIAVFLFGIFYIPFVAIKGCSLFPPASEKHNK